MPPQEQDRCRLPTRATAFIGRSSTRRLTQEVAGSGGEKQASFRHEDITGGRTHCGVCPWHGWRLGGYEQGVQVRSPPLVRTGPNSHEGRDVARAAERRRRHVDRHQSSLPFEHARSLSRLEPQGECKKRLMGLTSRSAASAALFISNQIDCRCSGVSPSRDAWNGRRTIGQGAEDASHPAS